MNGIIVLSNKGSLCNLWELMPMWFDIVECPFISVFFISHPHAHAHKLNNKDFANQMRLWRSKARSNVSNILRMLKPTKTMFTLLKERWFCICLRNTMANIISPYRIIFDGNGVCPTQKWSHCLAYSHIRSLHVDEVLWCAAGEQQIYGVILFSVIFGYLNATIEFM